MNEETALQPTNYTTGLGTLIKIRPTNITLVQNTTQDPKGAAPGDYLDLLTGESFKSITVVPLRISRQRVYFKPGSGFGEDPLCRSNDGVVPAPSIEHPPAKTCAACPKSKWYDRKKPDCSEKWIMLVVLRETLLPRNIQFGGKAIGVIRQALEAIQQDIVLTARKDGVKLEFFDYTFTLTSERVTNRQGVFFLPRIEGLKKIANPGEFGPLFMEYVVNAVHNDDETLENIAETAEAGKIQVDNVIDAEFTPNL